MKEIGFITNAQLGEMAARGLSPKEAVDALMTEAKNRHPEAGAIVMQRRQDGFAIVALRGDR